MHRMAKLMQDLNWEVGESREERQFDYRDTGFIYETDYKYLSIKNCKNSNILKTHCVH